MLLDLGLPRREGLEVLRNLRKRGKTVPVMILTARDTVEDRVWGLDAGADHYLLKPFSLDELLARLRALLRRAHGLADTQIRMGRLRALTRIAQSTKPWAIWSRSCSFWRVSMQQKTPCI